MKRATIEKLFQVFSLVLMLFSSMSYAQQELKVMTEDWPPLNYREGKSAAGPAVELVSMIQETLYKNSKITIMPWKRAYREVLDTKNTVLFSMSRTEERESLFKWVGPIASKRYAFYAQAGSNIKLARVEDAQNYKIGVQDGGVTEEFIRSHEFAKVEPIQNSKQNVDKLLKGRVDLWYESGSTVYETLRKESLPETSVEEVLVAKTQDLYIAFNKDTQAEVIDKWQQVLLTLYENGAIEDIYKKHNAEHLIPKLE